MELIKDSSSSAVSAPTGAGFGSSTLSTTTNSGTVRTLVKGVTDFAIVTGPTAAYVSWHYWNEAHNGQAQNRARELYCTAYPSDEVCNSTVVTKYFVEGYAYGGGCSTPTFRSLPIPDGQESYVEPRADNYCGPGGVIAFYQDGRRFDDSVFNGSFSIVKKNIDGMWFVEGNAYGGGCSAPTFRSLPIPGGQENNITSQATSYCGPGGQLAYYKSGSRFDDTVFKGSFSIVNKNTPIPWKDWPQAKRDAAVALLTNSDWQRLITSLPFGGTLDPGDIAIAPKIVIPGQEWDNPNTLGDDRRLKTVPGEYARPVVPDFDHDSDPDETDADDDNDGVIEPYDPEPRNPYVPKASTEPPSSPDDDTPPQSEGERAVSEVRQSYGDFLEKAENDAFENRLDAIEAKYKRAAAMEDEAAVDPNVGYEQDRLIAEADSERQQLEGDLGEAWWSSLSQYEQQLFDGHPQAEVDEIQMHMKQWDKATYEDVAHSILDHSSRKGYDPLDYLRAASNFSTSGAKRTSPEGLRADGTVKWEIINTGEFIEVDEYGKIITYGVNQ